MLHLHERRLVCIINNARCFTELWLGNDNLHRLTFSEDVMLRVDMEDFDGNIKYAEYTTFQVADEADKYRILIEGYSGTAGDSLTYASEVNKIAR